MRYYIIAGEASGDLHGSNLIKGILKHDEEAVFRFWGGDKMSALIGDPVKHIRDLAFMGFYEVIKHLPTIFKNIEFCKKDIISFKPDVVILIDYPGFNFRLFDFIKAHNFRLYYYISPQLWAWKKGRVKQIKKYVDRMYVIFPFELEFYAQNGLEVHYFGHPLLDELGEVSPVDKREEIVALLPGSRKQEISRMLPIYNSVAHRFPNLNFQVAAMSVLGEGFYHQFITAPNITICLDQTYKILNKAKAALVTSGTATLETALHQVPQVICYKSNMLSYNLARWLVKGISYIGIVNLIMNRAIVKELIQDHANAVSISEELEELMISPKRETILKDYSALRKLLGEKGSSERLAKDMVSHLLMSK